MVEYLTNAWYMFGWAEELGDALLSRHILGRRLMAWRLDDGSVSVLEDRCPHRFAPLSRGTRASDRITCGYHGLAFDAAGACVHNPFSDRIPAGARVRAFPAIERDSIVWMWPGDPDRADPALIPDFSFLPDSPVNRTVRGSTPMRAYYEYGTDNLMDLSHIEFVHKGSFAGGGVIFAGRHEVVQEGDTLHSNWWMPGIPPPSMAAGVYPPDRLVDHWLDMRWNAPASMRLTIGVTPAGTPRDAGLIVDQAHLLTPADDENTHYFWSSSRSTDLDAAEIDDALRALFHQAFDTEDKPMIEAAYDNVRGADFWEEKPLFLGIDAGGTRARRLLETLVRRERETEAV
jgi:vanillate O-demethylase monooxygenase subunit